MESLIITQTSSEYYWAYAEDRSSSSSSSRGQDSSPRPGFEPEVWMKPDQPLFRVEDLLDFSQHDEADIEEEEEEEEEILINNNHNNNNNNSFNNRTEMNIKNVITEDEACCYNKGLGLLPTDELEWLGNLMEDDDSSYYRFFKEERRSVDVVISTEITEEEGDDDGGGGEESMAMVHPCDSSRVRMQGLSKARSKRCRSSRPVTRHRRIGSNPLPAATEESQNSSPPSSSSLSLSSVATEEETEQVLVTAASCCFFFAADSPRFFIAPTRASTLIPSPPTPTPTLLPLPKKKNKNKKKKKNGGGTNGNGSSRNANTNGNPKKRAKVAAAAGVSDDDNGRRCSHCQVAKTPQWRAGPLGPKTLCNACGVRFKSGRLLPEYRPAGSPTFVNHLHSNSHRKVLEMRSSKNPRQPAYLPQEAGNHRVEEEREESCLTDSAGSTTTTLCSVDYCPM